jgi:hypothetical protein
VLEHHDGPLIPTCCNQEEDPISTVPTDPPILIATLTFPPGLDRNDLIIADEHYRVVATLSWRPDTPGVGNWDAALARLRYVRTTPWQRDEVGFRCTVEPLG